VIWQVLKAHKQHSWERFAVAKIIIRLIGTKTEIKRSTKVKAHVQHTIYESGSGLY